MAVRKTLLIVGDVTAAGNRPVSELNAINSSYDDPQADCFIWNIQSQVWQSLTPGTNTNSAVLGSDRWSYESRFREAMRSEFPTGNLYVIKYSLDSVLTHTGSKPSWTPGIAGNAYALTIAQITNAAAAANLAGDTLSIDGIVISVQTDDWNLSSWRSYGGLLRSVIDAVRSAVSSIPYCTAGTFRADGNAIPVAVIEPHYKYTGMSTAARGQLNLCRMQAQALASNDERISVIRTHAETCTDSISFSSASMVSMATDVAKSLLEPEAPNDLANPDGRIALIISDSVCEGYSGSTVPGAGVLSDLPDHLQGAISGASIWRPNQGDFQTLQVGVNNLTSLPNAPAGFGPEVILASEMRGSGDIWLVKGSAIGAFGSIYLGTQPTANPPHYDRTMVSWSPAARNQLWELSVRGWLVSAVDLLRKQSKRPKLELVVICLGHSDLLEDDALADQVAATVRQAIASVQKLVEDLSISGTPRFVVCVPSASMQADETLLGTVRDSLLAIPETVENVSTIDLSSYATVPSGTILTGASQIKLAQDIYSAWKQTQVSSVQPMFMSSMIELRKALRLSKLGQDNDALSMIDSAVQAVKAGFFRNLGEEKIKSAFREGSFLATREEIRRLDEEIRQNLAVLYSASFVDSTNISVDIVKPDDTIAPGETVLNVL